MINVIIADHQPIFRVGLAKLLAAEDDIRIIAQPQSSSQLLVAVERLRPHVIILSSSFLPVSQEIDTIARAAGRSRIAILVLCVKTDNVSEFARVGVRGVLYRSVSADLLGKSVRRLAEGSELMRLQITPEICADQIGERVSSRLSRRERRIIAEVVQGYKNREVATHLGTSEQMIKNVLRIIFDKTGVSDRLELALFVMHHQVLAGAIEAARPVSIAKSTLATAQRTAA